MDANKTHNRPNLTQSTYPTRANVHPYPAISQASMITQSYPLIYCLLIYPLAQKKHYQRTYPSHHVHLNAAHLDTSSLEISVEPISTCTSRHPKRDAGVCEGVCAWMGEDQHERISESNAYAG